jgi:hypothetical protein
MFFLPGAVLSTDSGKKITISGAINAGDTQLIFTGSGTAEVTDKVVSMHWFSSVAKCVGDCLASSNIFVYKDTSFAGISIAKKLNLLGVGRENLEITGSFTVTGLGGNSTFNNMHLKEPSSGTTLMTVSGVGGMDFRDCQLNPGTGNVMFEWDRDGTTPQIVELMQTKLISGKLLKAESTSPQTYQIHVKESSLFSITEANLLEPVGGNFVVLLIANSLVNIANAQISTSSNAQFRLRAACEIDDQTTNVAWFDNNGTGFDTLEISDGVTIKFDSGDKFLSMSSNLTGAGTSATSTNFQTVPSTSLLTFDADLFDEVFYEGTATPLTFVQSWAIKAGAGQYKGQKFRLHIIGSIDTNGNTVNMFGRAFTPASQEMQGLTVEGIFDGTNWITSYSDLI